MPVQSKSKALFRRGSALIQLLEFDQAREQSSTNHADAVLAHHVGFVTILAAASD